MKYLMLVVMMILGMNCFGQVKLYRSVDDDNPNDSTITSGSDTLAGEQVSKRQYIFLCKVKVYMNKTGSKRDYHLYFQFENIWAFSLSTDNKAIIKFTDGSRLELPYFGKYEVYGEKESADFPIDVTNYTTQLSTKEIKYVQLETSKGDYNVPVPEQFKNKIKNIMLALVND